MKAAEAPRPTTRALLAIGAVGGLLSGLLGVGGGIVLVPLLVLWLKLPQRRANAISVAAIVPISLVGAFSYIAAGEVRFDLALALIAGAIPGALIGTHFLRLLDERLLNGLLGAVLVVFAVLAVLR